jgi:hypothetical protein
MNASYLRVWTRPPRLASWAPSVRDTTARVLPRISMLHLIPLHRIEANHLRHPSIPFLYRPNGQDKARSGSHLGDLDKRRRIIIALSWYGTLPPPQGCSWTSRGATNRQQPSCARFATASAQVVHLVDTTAHGLSRLRARGLPLAHQPRPSGTPTVQTTVTTIDRRCRRTSMVCAAQTQCQLDAPWPLLSVTQFTNYCCQR